MTFILAGEACKYYFECAHDELCVGFQKCGKFLEWNIGVWITIELYHCIDVVEVKDFF